MDIIFSTRKLQKELLEHKQLVRKHGLQRAKLIERRLTQLRAANTLQDLSTLPQLRCHELKGDMRGYISLDLDHPYRLIISCANSPKPIKSNGALNWVKVTAITIEDIKDTHG